MSEPSPIELEFSRKYDFDHAQQYLQKHQDGLARRLSHWRDLQLARRALQLATILEPLLIVSMGLIVMLIVLAVLQPIIELNQFVK